MKLKVTEMFNEPLDHEVYVAGFKYHNNRLMAVLVLDDGGIMTTDVSTIKVKDVDNETVCV